MKNTYNSRLSAFKPFSAGDMVWIASKDYPSQRPSQKLEMRHYGPFKVLSRQGASTYKIAIPFEWKKHGIHNVFNHTILSPYVAPFFPSQMVPLPLSATLGLNAFKSLSLEQGKEQRAAGENDQNKSGVE